MGKTNQSHTYPAVLWQKLTSLLLAVIILFGNMSTPIRAQETEPSAPPSQQADTAPDEAEPEPQNSSEQADEADVQPPESDPSGDDNPAEGDEPAAPGEKENDPAEKLPGDDKDKLAKLPETVFEGSAEGLAIEIKVTADEPGVVPEGTTVNAVQVPVLTPEGEAVAPQAATTPQDLFYQSMITEDTLVIDVSGESTPAQNNSVSTESLEQMAEGEPGLLPGNMAAVPMDITLSLGGEEIQPQGTVTVSVQIPAGMDPANAAVYYVPESGNPQKMPGQAVDGWYVFATTHFTRYTLISTTVTAGTKLTDADAGKELTGGNVYYVDKDTAIGGENLPSRINGLRVGGTSSTSPAVLYIPHGVTLTVIGCKGSYNPNGNWGAAAIYLPDGQYLYVRGGGTLNATGGEGRTAYSGLQSVSSYISTIHNGSWRGTAGGAGGIGGTGAGAGIGTNGAGGGAGGQSVDEDFVRPVNALTVGSGRTGNPGSAGSNSENAGTLYVLDTVILNARGGAAADSGAGGNAAASSNDKGSGWDNSYFAGAGGGGGGGGAGGAGAGIGSGGAGGGGGGAGGTGGRTMNTGTYGDPASYPTGGGGAGGGGSSGGKAGMGTQRRSGGTGGAAGAAGVAGSGGHVYVASTAVCSNYGGKDANGQAAVMSQNKQYNNLNSLYTVTLDKNAPSSSAAVTAPTHISLQAGVLPGGNGSYAARTTGWTFLGWYSAKTGGVQVIDSYGYFASDAAGYTNVSGGWIYGDDATLYARWQAGVYQVTLSNQGAALPGTAALYLKYDHGWYAAQSCSGSQLTAITVPAKRGYTFMGYHTGIGGSGTGMIAANGSITAGKTDITEDIYLYAHWVATPHTATLTLTRENVPYSGVPVQLYQYGYLKYTLDEDETTGVYTNSDVITGTYQIYVDGRNTGRSFTIDNADNSGTLAFTDYTLTTMLDGTEAQIGTVTLRRDGATLYTMDYAGGRHAVAVIVEGGAALDVYMGSENTGLQLSADSPAHTANYYTAVLQLTYDELWKDAQVTLWQNGRMRHMLAYNSGKDSGKTTTYSKIVYSSEAPGANNVYDIYINGRNTGQTVVISQTGFEATPKQTLAADAYYRATAAIEKDGAPWASGASVQLAHGGTGRYTLNYNAAEKLYSWDYVQVLGDGTETEYDVMVLGSASGTETGLKIKSDNPAVSADYFTVTYKTVTDKGLPTELEVDYLVQVVRGNTAAPKPPDPYIKGIGFGGWFESDGIGGYAPTAFDFDTAITAPVTVYAMLAVPEAAINGYMRCNSDGAMAEDGRYYRMVNFTVGGYPAEGNRMLMLTLTSVNGSVHIKGTPPKGCTLYNNINADGNGTLTLTCGSGVNPAQLEAFVREQLLVKVEDGAQTHTIQITVFGSM